MVIIIDHLWRFPSLFMFFTGQAKLWVTAAEGFVIISGFLIGYVRGRKGLKRSFTDIAKALIKRAGILYIWMVLASLLYVWIELSKLIPSMPYSLIGETKDWGRIAASFLMTEKPHVWVHFLYLYTVFLLLAVLAVGLMRQKKAYLVVALSLTLYLFGLLSGIEWLKWQLIFFIPSVVGFYFEPLRDIWRQYSQKRRRLISASILCASAITLAVSTMSTFPPELAASPMTAHLNSMFIIEDFFPTRVLIAFLWFSALAIIFQRITPWLHQHTRGILEYIGTHSLTMYVAHGLIICMISYFFSGTRSFWLNTLYGVLAVLGTYIFIRLPFIRNILPK